MSETSLRMAELATSNRVQLTVPLWLYVPRTFSSNTELGIRSTSPVRRNRNKERPYELLIVMALPPPAQHPFKIQILFKSNRLCWALSCGSLSTAALREKESDGCSRKRNQLEAPWCLTLPPANMLLSRESLNYLFWEDSNLYPPNVQQEPSMWGPPELSFLLMVVHHPRLPGLRVSCIETALLINSNTQITHLVCGTQTHICDILSSYSQSHFSFGKRASQGQCW